MPALDIVIVNWNSGPWLRECLQALAGATPIACTLSRVVVVDNASTDGSCDGLERARHEPVEHAATGDELTRDRAARHESVGEGFAKDDHAKDDHARDDHAKDDQAENDGAENGRAENDRVEDDRVENDREGDRVKGGHVEDDRVGGDRVEDDRSEDDRVGNDRTTPESDRAISKLPLTIVRNGVNRGFAAACNQGAAESRADYLLFLNPDTVPTAEALDGAVGLLEARAADSVKIAGVWLDNTDGAQTLWLGAFPTARTFILQAMGQQHRWKDTVALAPPTPLPPSTRLPPSTPPSASSPVSARSPALIAASGLSAASAPLVSPSASPTEASAVSDDPFGAIEVAVVGGAFFVIARPLFEELNGFDERFFMYYDELDLCLRARQRGARAMVASRVRIYHHSGASTDRVPGKRLFYLLRSRLRYARTHFSTPQTTALAVLMCTCEPLLRLGRAAAGRGPDRVRDVIEAYARFAASLAGFAPDARHSPGRS